MFRIFVTGFFLSITAIIWAWIIVLAVFEDTFVGPLLGDLTNHSLLKRTDQFRNPKEIQDLASSEASDASDFRVMSSIANRKFSSYLAIDDPISGQIATEMILSHYKHNAHQAMDSTNLKLLTNSLPNALILGSAKSRLVTSPFSKSRYHPILGKLLPHKGIDVGAPEGTPVMAVADGKIAFVGKKPKAGRLIKIAHGPSKESRYLHLSGFSSLAKVGRKIFAGDVIGFVGQSGLTTGPHLHFEVWIGGKAVSPSDYHLFELAPTRAPLLRCFERLVFQALSARRIGSLEISVRQKKSTLVDNLLLASVSF
jgi:murein DD-endopeptidase MepM/ murein hydrolase activator NlpD